MVCIREDVNRRFGTGDSSLVLLARLLDGARRPVCSSDVVSLLCSVRDPGAREPDSKFEVNPREVLLPALVIGESWKVDDIGYNFRHDLVNAARFLTAVAPQFDGRVEVEYVFSLINCTRAKVRFRLKLV